MKRPGVYEAPLGFPLQELIYELGGGMLHDDRPLKAVIPGGSSVPVLRADECDVDLDFDSLAAKGTMLGSAGIMVMDSSTCMVDARWRASRTSTPTSRAASARRAARAAAGSSGS